MTLGGPRPRQGNLLLRDYQVLPAERRRRGRPGPISPRNHVHHFRLHDADDIDDKVAGWFREAYAVGEQRHLARRSDGR